MLRLYDTLRGEVREIVLREPGHLSMYVCGPTVYDLPHLGHGRFTLVWDVARRWFSYRGLQVRYVSNITDIDDNIISRAQREGTTETQVAATYEGEWWSAMSALGVARPDDVPHATHYVDSMVSLIQDLLGEDVAYVLSDGVYFDTSRVADYGLLAEQPLDSLRAGSGIDASEEKRSALDFALWKFAKPDEPVWAAPFGPGRPGWHTECVVMSLELLGDGFDLHCGGLDLKFPHHENERAQAQAARRPFAQHWGHSGWVMVGEQKMSKSLGNFTSLTDLLARTDPRAYRLLVIRSHYRSPIEVSPETIADAERALARLDALARRFELPELGADELVHQSHHEFSGQAAQMVERVGEMLDDDLNTPLAVAEIFDGVSAANAMADQGESGAALQLAEAVGTLLGALGLQLCSRLSDIDEDVQALVSARDLARSEGNWVEADRVRDELVARGWIVEDSTHGTRVRRAN